MPKLPSPEDSENKIVPLRKGTYRGATPLHAGSPAEPHADRDLGKYSDPGDSDDYRHRMITNAAGLAVAAALIAAGIWLADTMASMRKNQDCVLSGRRGCTPVDALLPQRW